MTKTYRSMHMLLKGRFSGYAKPARGYRNALAVGWVVCSSGVVDSRGSRIYVGAVVLRKGAVGIDPSSRRGGIGEVALADDRVSGGVGFDGGDASTDASSVALFSVWFACRSGQAGVRHAGRWVGNGAKHQQSQLLHAGTCIKDVRLLTSVTGIVSGSPHQQSSP